MSDNKTRATRLNLDSGDYVCLGTFPNKPMRVSRVGIHSLTLSNDETGSFREIMYDEFDRMNYYKCDEEGRFL